MDYAFDFDIRSEPDFMLHHIKTAIPLPGNRLRLTFEDGISGEVDMKPIIQRGGVFAGLADPGRFRQVQIAPTGRYCFGRTNWICAPMPYTFKSSTISSRNLVEQG